MAKITLITQWFPPEPAYLLEDLAVFLQEKKHDVTVITGFPNYPYGEIYEGYKQSLTQIEDINGVRVVRLPVYPNHSRSVIKRGTSYISFSLSVLFIGIFRVGRPDIILCYSPPLTTGLAAAFVAKIKKVPFILNVQDMWPDTLISSGMVKEGKLTNLIGRVAKWLYKNAKGVVVLSDGFNTHLRNLGVAGDKIHTISNWSSNDDDKATETHQREDNWRKTLGIANNDFIVMFAGNMGSAQALDTIIEAANLIKEHAQIKIVFVGNGMSLDSLKSKVKADKLNNVIFAGRVAYKEMDGLYDIANALLIHLKKDPLFKITIPHKLLTYLSKGKPIISAVPGEVNSIVKKSSAGFTCDAENPGEMAKLILKTSKLKEQELNEIKQQSIDYFLNNFSKEVLLGKWESVILKILEKQSKLRGLKHDWI